MISFFKKLFGIKYSINSNENTFPSDWKLTVSELFDELKNGRIKQIAEPELSWAREYERSLIPKNYRFPKKGDLYRSKFNQSSDYLTSWSAPYTGGGTATILEGEHIWIDSDSSDKKPIGVYAIPVDYKKLEERIVPSSDRDSFKYEGFYFHISTKTINENFDLIQTKFKKEKYI